jgi:hypothetical protein
MGCADEKTVFVLHHFSHNGGAVYDIPDFHSEECRKEYENDRLTPFVGSDGSKPSLPCCSVADYSPTEEQIRKMDELLNS